jgi:hypothetical protein
MNNNKNIKKSIASANINFLIGSGVSAPFLETLTDIEKQLSAYIIFRVKPSMKSIIKLNACFF